MCGADIRSKIIRSDGEVIFVKTAKSGPDAEATPASPARSPPHQPLLFTPIRRRDVNDDQSWKSPRFPVYSSATSLDESPERSPKRTKYGRRSGEWRYEAQSPPKASEPMQTTDSLDNAQQTWQITTANPSMPDHNAPITLVSQKSISNAANNSAPNGQSEENGHMRTQKWPVESDSRMAKVLTEPSPSLLPSISRSESISNVATPLLATVGAAEHVQSPRTMRDRPDGEPRPASVQDEQSQPLTFGLDGSISPKAPRQPGKPASSHHQDDPDQSIDIEEILASDRLSIEMGDPGCQNEHHEAEDKTQSPLINPGTTIRPAPHAESEGVMSQDMIAPHEEIIGTGKATPADIFDEYILSSPARDEPNATVAMERLKVELSSSDPGPVSLPVKSGMAALATPSDSQEAPASTASFLHPVDRILSGQPPLTPGPTQSDLSEMTSSPPKKPLNLPQNEVPNAHTPRRHSMSRSAQETPDAMSPWFSSRRSSGRISSSRVVSTTTTPSAGRATTKSVPAKGKLGGRKVGSPLTKTGFRTKLSYYAPLDALETYMAASSSQGAVTIDLFGIITDASSKPAKAKAGPKDYSVTFKMTDLSVHPASTQVQCFRPYATSLPKADIGDVILLRDFVVKTKQNQCYLLSAEASAWHVWRYSTPKHHQQSEAALSFLYEESNGPPVELGSEEQTYAVALRQWWAS